MRGFGIFFVIAGIVWALIAFNVDTSVPTAYGSVNNIGLMAARTNNLMFAGLTILIGVVLIGFGSNSKQDAPALGLKACPVCAEQIQPAALKCRYCNSDLPDDFRAAAITPAVVPLTESERLRSQIALIEQGTASMETYIDVASLLGGSLTPAGFLLGMHYVVDLGGVSSRVEKFEDLRQWFLDNAVPRAGV